MGDNGHSLNIKKYLIAHQHQWAMGTYCEYLEGLHCIITETKLYNGLGHVGGAVSLPGFAIKW